MAFPAAGRLKLGDKAKGEPDHRHSRTRSVSSRSPPSPPAWKVYSRRSRPLGDEPDQRPISVADRSDFRPVVFDPYVSTFDKADFLKTLAECGV